MKIKDMKIQKVRLDELDMSFPHYMDPAFVEALTRAMRREPPTEADTAPRAETVRVRFSVDGVDGTEEDMALVTWHRFQYCHHCALYPHLFAWHKQRFQRIVNDKISIWDEIQEFVLMPREH